MTFKELAIQQIKLFERVQAEAKINIVNCGNCGDTILHEIGETEITCVGCSQTMDVSDCPDLWYDGMEINY